jgi:NTP pyrophosphatase (non-canonical NTP hydrolase)
MVPYNDIFGRVIRGFFKTYQDYKDCRPPKGRADTALKLCEESGEVAVATFAIKGSKSKIEKIARGGQTPEENLIEELGDVIIVAMNVAHVNNIPLPVIFDTATKKMQERINERLKVREEVER